MPLINNPETQEIEQQEQTKEQAISSSNSGSDDSLNAFEASILPTEADEAEDSIPTHKSSFTSARPDRMCAFKGLAAYLAIPSQYSTHNSINSIMNSHSIAGYKAFSEYIVNINSLNNLMKDIIKEGDCTAVLPRLLTKAEFRSINKIEELLECLLVNLHTMEKESNFYTDSFRLVRWFLYKCRNGKKQNILPIKIVLSYQEYLIDKFPF